MVVSEPIFGVDTISYSFAHCAVLCGELVLRINHAFDFRAKDFKLFLGAIVFLVFLKGQETDGTHLTFLDELVCFIIAQFFVDFNCLAILEINNTVFISWFINTWVFTILTFL